MSLSDDDCLTLYVALCSESGGLLVLSESREYIRESCGLVHGEAKVNSLSRIQSEGAKYAQHSEILNRMPFKASISWHGIDIKKED